MTNVPERTSPATRARWPALLALAFCLTPIARAAPPENAWGTGIVLPGTEDKFASDVTLLPDGPAGVLAITSSTTAYVSGGEVRLHRVLPQGRLDPSLPGGATLIHSVDLRMMQVIRAVGDDAGGGYLFVNACDPSEPLGSCVGRGEMRLLHFTSQGLTAPGWPALGFIINTNSQGRGAYGRVDIVSDGAGGVIAAWLEGSPPAVRAQRFSPGGISMWPGDLSGQVVLAQRGWRSELLVAGDHAGGIVVVVPEVLPEVLPERVDAYAGRMDAWGNSVWGTAGKTVWVQPGYSVIPHTVAVDGSGRALVGGGVSPSSGGYAQFRTQMLSPSGARLWTNAGVSLGIQTYGDTRSVSTAAGFVTFHRNPPDLRRVQNQDEFGRWLWGEGPEGISFGSAPGPVFLVPTGDGHLMCVWDAGGAQATTIRALELDEGGRPLPDWPDTGAVVCCGDPLPPVCCDKNVSLLRDAISSGGHVVVAFHTSEHATSPIKVQRLSRAVLAVEPPVTAPRAALLLAPPSPNPSREAWSLRFELAEASAVALEVLDIAGRRVLREDLGGFPAGPQLVPVPRGASLAPGVYRLRLKAGPHTAERMLVRAR